MSIMKKLLKEEYDFYYFIRQRFSTYREKMRKDLPERLWNETLHLEDLHKERPPKKVKRKVR